MSTTPNMATIAASLSRSLQNCSLNHHQSSSTGAGDAAETPDSPPSPAVELNSEASLPFHWEQCLDLKTGEIYYINWRTGMKAKEDPRENQCYSDDDCSSYDSEEGSSSESSSREQWSGNNQETNEQCYYRETNDIVECNTESTTTTSSNSNVLVVAGCKSCLMYYMVPKQLGICPKCCGELLHFDRSIP